MGGKEELDAYNYSLQKWLANTESSKDLPVSKIDWTKYKVYRGIYNKKSCCAHNSAPKGFVGANPAPVTKFFKGLVMLIIYCIFVFIFFILHFGFIYADFIDFFGENVHQSEFYIYSLTFIIFLSFLSALIPILGQLILFFLFGEIKGFVFPSLKTLKNCNKIVLKDIKNKIKLH